jgi:hypothetical protein
VVVHQLNATSPPTRRGRRNRKSTLIARRRRPVLRLTTGARHAGRASGAPALNHIAPRPARAICALSTSTAETLRSYGGPNPRREAGTGNHLMRLALASFPRPSEG